MKHSHYFNNSLLTHLLKECVIHFIITGKHHKKYNFHHKDSPHNTYYQDILSIYKNMYRRYKNNKIYTFKNKKYMRDKYKYILTDYKQDNKRERIENINFYNFKILEIITDNNKDITLYKQQSIKDIILNNKIIQENTIECTICHQFFSTEEIDKHLQQCIQNNK